MPEDNCRQRFTWLHFVVVSLIAVVAGGLLLPALQAFRETGRNNTCRNNLRNLTLATIQFSKMKQRYPGYAESFNGNERSWTFVILPLLERQDIYVPHVIRNTPQPTQELEVVLCTSLKASHKNKLGVPASSFIANTGLPDVAPTSANGPPADWPANGVLHDLRDLFDVAGNPLPKTTISENYISKHDGTAYTIMLSESLDARSWVLVGTTNFERQMGFVWSPQVAGNPPRPAPPPSLRINVGVGGDPTWTSMNHARPSSVHPGIVNVSFCDGHVRTMSEKIDYRVFCQLMTPHGERAQFPGKVASDEDSLDDPAYVDSLFRGTLTTADEQGW